MFFCTYDCPRVAADLLDDPREIDEPRIRVAVLRAGFEHAAAGTASSRRADSTSSARTAPRLRRRRTATSDSESRPNATAASGSVMLSIIPYGSWICAQLRHPPRDLVVERQLAAIAELHDRDRGERLRDRSPVEDRAVVDALARCLVGEPVVVAREDLAVAHDERAGADDLVAIGVRVEQTREARPAGWRRTVLRRGRWRADGADAEKRGREREARSNHLRSGTKAGAMMRPASRNRQTSARIESG